MIKNKKAAALTAVFFAYLIWGFSFVFSRIALQITTPSVLLAWRFVIGLAFISAFTACPKYRLSFSFKRLLPLIALGLFEPVAYFYCENYGIALTNASFSGLMIALIPLFSMFAAFLFLGEKPTVRQTVFSVVSVSGIILMVMRGRTDGVITAAGVIFLIGAVISAVASALLMRKISGTYSAFERTFVMVLVGSVVFTASAIIENRADLAMLFAPFSEPVFLAAAAYLGLFCSTGAFFLLNYAATYLPVMQSSAFCNLTTAVSIAAGVIFLNEPFSLTSALASVFILVGIWGVQKFAAQ